MHSYTAHRHVAAPPDAVWAVLTDIDSAPRVLSAVTRVERLTDGDGFAVGTRWRETRLQLGRAATEELTVTHLEPGRSLTQESSTAGVRYVTRFTVVADDDGTSLTMSFSAIHPNPGLGYRLLAKLFGSIGLKTTAAQMNQDLADLAAAAENQAS